MMAAHQLVLMPLAVAVVQQAAQVAQTLETDM
jgi:hypothetical protein